MIGSLQDEDIDAKVHHAADQILMCLGNTCKGDVPIGLAALALAIASLARVDQVPLSDIEQLLWTAYEAVSDVPDISKAKRVRQ